mmetsp:Transcript_75126/g.162453  ORF Transcript_75126/g.162453 Transcript_75126/m.162453 type:complete len:148 (-) Transcript_75126:2071-2514(-)
MMMNKIPASESKADCVKRTKLFAIFDKNSQCESDGKVNRADFLKKLREWIGSENLLDFSEGIEFVFNQVVGNSGGTEHEMDLDAFTLFMKRLKDLIKIYILFNKLDESADKRISVQEFYAAFETNELESLGLQELSPFKEQLFKMVD